MSWLIPDWPAPPQVRALCTTRLAPEVEAQTEEPYGFNLGDQVGDDAARVAGRRLQLQSHLGLTPLWLRQVHGVAVLDQDAWFQQAAHRVHDPELAVADGPVADASWSMRSGGACALLVADCLPVLLTDAQGSFVASAHAGWRGLSGGILEQLFQALPQSCTRNTAQLMAWLGPCIGPTVFEVGDEVRLAFARHLPDSGACFMAITPSDRQAPKWLADLPGLARMALRRLGIEQIYGNNGSLPWCTFSNPSRFFSYRRERVCGRMGAFIGLLEP